MFEFCRSASAKLHSLAKLRLQRWLVGLWQCVQCGFGFHLSFAGGRKKQNKFPQVCTDLSKN